MPSTYSDRLRLELIASGEQSGTWGTTTNTNLGTLLDEAVAGVSTVGVVNGTNTLTSTDGSSDQARRAVIVLTGSLSTTTTIVCPSKQKVYIVKNSTTGGQAVTIKTSAGTGISVPMGESTAVYCDGTNVYDATTYLSTLDLGTALTVANGGTGSTTASAARTALGLGTIATQAASAVAITGGTITGITDLTIADGGTGASTAENARTNLGLGTIATQAASAVAITGGTIAATSVDAVTLLQGGVALNTLYAPNGTLSSYNPETASYTLALTDKGAIVEMNSATAVNLTVPPNSSVAFPLNTVITLVSIGLGQTTIVAGSGVTLLSYGSKKKLSGQYSMATLIKKSDNVWWLAGDLMG